MPFNFTVSPDFAPDHMSGWFYFNTWLQRKLGTDIHLELYDGFDSQRADIRAGKIDLIYANPYDASMLVREMGFKAVARPAGKRDEAVIVVPADSAVQQVEDLAEGIRIATTADPDVHTIGMIMLEPADLDAGNTEQREYDSYILIAKALMRGQADAGFFLKQGYDELSDLIKKQMRVIVSSQISVVHHALLVGPSMQDRFGELSEALISMKEDEKGLGVLESMGLQGWESMSVEQTEFMIDLIDTLID
ncbi:MAG: phosphate ABC transporter substrate-binding protein [Oceanospirillaceae bacterium]|jgi:phosphonate transport system substrate-binding protein|uniref:phosphate/phosphite/phosphonate ABC transporter substrate-binding protein n=1 Tax=Marinobacterium litorale TaxID=404770 RepID=UPI000405AF58|nr:phosphate/phosphite/phosphonate ABC transporter substrate-binding protein [Marinobacterium litorale]MBS98529.1 phosphate ABC transporter substrate-binding protein [Oceanospirillaceae bacterium]